MNHYRQGSRHFHRGAGCPVLTIVARTKPNIMEVPEGSVHLPISHAFTPRTVLCLPAYTLTPLAAARRGPQSVTRPETEWSPVKLHGRPASYRARDSDISRQIHNHRAQQNEESGQEIYERGQFHQLSRQHMSERTFRNLVSRHRTPDPTVPNTATDT